MFGPVATGVVRQILDRHLRNHLGSGIGGVIFEAGAIGAVFGLQLADGREVVVKGYQPGSDLDRLGAVVRCQTLLTDRGFPCAAVLSPPRITSGIPMVVEQLLGPSSTGNPHDPRSVGAMVSGLARQIRLLSDVDGEALNRGRPAWADWETGAWPRPHDPIFDFTAPAPGYEWVDRRADAHADKLRQLCGTLPKVIGHTDWVWQNVGVRDGELVAAYDWDSLAFLPEPVIVGLGAGAYTQGSPLPPDAPSWPEVAHFIAAYEQVRGAFTADEAVAARHAAGWVRCYNARCQVDNQQRRCLEPPNGSFVEMMISDEVGWVEDESEAQVR